MRAADDPPPALVTTAERSGYQETGRYDEVVRLCGALAARYPRQARCTTFGRTPEGRPMLALVVSADGVLEPAAARRKQRPVLLAIGGIHAGEIDGKDAGFALLRDLLGSRDRALAAVTVVFVPVFNVDGHERFGPNQRPNQRGPRAGGFRTTAQNLNLNRDWVKVEAPEMSAALALLNAWDPVMLVDLHVTDGAKFEHDVAVMVAPRAGVIPGLGEVAQAVSDAVQAGLTARQHLPLPFYPAFRKDELPESGIDDGPRPLRYSHSYWAARNRLGVLVETHSWRPYPHRVRTTRDTLEVLLGLAVRDGARWLAAERAADQAARALGGREVPLGWKSKAPPRVIDFRGYAYRREHSPISAGTWIRYDEQRPQIWKLPLYDQLTPGLVVRAPRAGYLVPAAHAGWVAVKLAAHDIQFRRLAGALADAPTTAYRARQVEFATAPFEGRFTARVTGAWASERRSLGAGALYVPIDQPRARLLMQLLEPEAADSLVSWGFFHGAFEQKEYMEAYVAEEEARRMLERDPGLRATFDAALAADPAMARDPEKRLRFFYQRHPSWDERLDLYPILRLDDSP